MTTLHAPSTSRDLYDDATLTDPYSAYAELRGAGSAVYLERHGVYALPRYAEVRRALGDWETFSSAAGVSIAPQFDRLYAGSVIASDPPEHDVLRSVLAERLAPRALRPLRADIEARADALVAEVVARGSFDAVADLAQVFPVSVVADLVGVPQEGRERFLDRANRNFNLFGPANERALDSLGVHDESLAYVREHATRDRLAPGSFGATVYEAIDAGIVSERQGLRLLMTYLFAGMDTTINAIGHAIWLFARQPEQWRALRADPSLVGPAFEEVLRLESPVQGFARTVRRDVAFDDARVPEGARVLLLYGSANRDERRWADADRFDIRRDASGHVAFGYGVHGCAGQGLARIEAHAILSALARRVESFECGTPQRRLNNAVRGLAALPTTVVPAA
ncbi:cytochrome P450 [Solirubrobacter ginsenosidimutans]|uniref:Cytochrome P450 n=1 Tax=Solirubrobacter ginsenosidimutans TaxID=490573 RepID=A0A9X3MMY0_9ACTN|nr:cytochrome P450 [Solirubrobacter ginsenosidimutans]MDA0159070.1 cytochrome P450 [Solirubrobacter ginsenosidimutans]